MYRRSSAVICFLQDIFKIHNPAFKIASCVSLAALTLLILWLALMPADAAPSGLGWDKLNHAGAIAVVTGIAFFSFRSRTWAAAGAFLYGTSLGVLIEVLQATMATGRSAEWSDVVADLIGAGCAWAVIKCFNLKKAINRR